MCRDDSRVTAGSAMRQPGLLLLHGRSARCGHGMQALSFATRGDASTRVLGCERLTIRRGW
jgi:hypothetical protein